MAELLLARPPVNALSLDMWRAIADALESINADTSVLVLASDVERAFCAGADVNEFVELTPDTRRERHGTVTKVLKALTQLPIPTVCAIDGPAIGAGVALAACCDYRIASSKARFAFPEIGRGTAAGGGAFLRQLGVPEGAIRYLLYSGEPISAQEAFRLNIVDEVVENARTARDRSHEVGQTFSRHGERRLNLMKKALLGAHIAWYDWLAAYEETHNISADLIGLDETQQSMKAFLRGTEN